MLAERRQLPAVQRVALAPVAVVLGGIVMKSALEAAVVADVGLFVAGQAIVAQPELLLDRQLVDRADQSAPGFFDFTYENTVYDYLLHCSATTRCTANAAD